MAQQQTETRRLRMHENLLFAVIQRQAGTLGKAILEGVMNAADAGATRCDITLTETKLEITDDGKGFKGREEIETFFEVFGQPHDPSEQKRYGTFRMGRGQLFAFGSNTWRSGEHQMDVDIKNKGLDYVLGTQKKTAGCRIAVQLYDPLLSGGLRDICAEVREYVKWAPLEVRMNKQLISKDPATAKWDYETERCYVKLKESGGLAIYNLGVLVKTCQGYQFGIGGEAVSKQQMKVNFARNDVMSDCPVWRDMKKFIDKHATARVTRRHSLTDSARERLLRDFCRGEIGSPDEFTALRLFTDVNGRHWSLYQLRHLTPQYSAFTAATPGDTRGDFLHQAKMAFVFSAETLKRCGTETAEQFMDVLRRNDPYYDADRLHYRWQFVEFADAVAGIDNEHRIILEDEWRPREKLAVQVADLCQRFLTGALGVSRYRSVIIGDGLANGWTDGSSYIAISRSWLADVDLATAEGLTAYAQLLLHELCHDDDDTATHVHSPEFYQTYHDAHAGIPNFVRDGLIRVPQYLASIGRQLTRKQLKQVDSRAKARRAAAVVDQFETAAVAGR